VHRTPLLRDAVSAIVLAFEIMDEEAQPLGLTTNWSKVQSVLDPATLGNHVTIKGDLVEVVKLLPYAGSIPDPLYWRLRTGNITTSFNHS